MRILFASFFITLFTVSISAQDSLYVIKKDPNCHQTLTGRIKNYKNNEPILGAVVDLTNNGELVSKISSSADGAFTFTLDCSTRYSISATQENFTNNSKIIYTSSRPENKTLDLFLFPAREFIERNANKYIDTDYIDFEIDVQSLSLNASASKELEKVINIMRKYPDIKVSVDVHTDSKGEAEYAKNITQERASEIVDYFISKGIDSSRLEAHGYGDTKLFNHCQKDIKCSEAEHKANRRIEFLVIQ